MKWSDENDKVFPAFFAVLGEVTNPKKNADNPFYHSKYTTLEALHAHVKPILRKHKLELSQEPGEDLNGRPTVRNIFYHESGQSGEQSTPYPLILEKETPQGGGSSFTYGCRYTLTGILGIVSEEDDDGNAAEPKKTTDKKSTTTSNKPTETTAGGVDREKLYQMQYTLINVGIGKPTKGIKDTDEIATIRENNKLLTCEYLKEHDIPVDNELNPLWHMKPREWAMLEDLMAAAEVM